MPTEQILAETIAGIQRTSGYHCFGRWAEKLVSVHKGQEVVSCAA